MTPLAQRIVNEFHAGKPCTSRLGLEHVVGKLAEAHCYEMTDTLPLWDMLLRRVFDLEKLRQIAARLLTVKPDAPSNLCLQSTEILLTPAPVTWIEANIKGSRVGYLLVELEDHLTEVRMVLSDANHVLEFGRLVMYMHGHASAGSFEPLLGEDMYVDGYSELERAVIMCRMIAMLALVNSPKVIHHVEHAPHKGLARKVGHAKRLGRPAPLKPWTEIRLSVYVRPPGTTNTGTLEHDEQGMVHGGRALHYCRKHLRVRKGRLETVSGHWRGDAALGTRPTDHHVKP